MTEIHLKTGLFTENMNILNNVFIGFWNQTLQIFIKRKLNLQNSMHQIVCITEKQVTHNMLDFCHSTHIFSTLSPCLFLCNNPWNLLTGVGGGFPFLIHHSLSAAKAKYSHATA